MILRRMQALLARLYDAPVAHDVADYLVSDRKRFAALVGAAADDAADEQVVVVQGRNDVRIGL